MHHTQRDVCKVVYDGTIKNRENVEMTKLSLNRLLYKVWFIHKMKFPVAVKVNELDIHVSIYINLKMIMLSGKYY